MKHSILSHFFVVASLAVAVLALPGTVWAVSSGGKIHCTGNHNYRLNGTEQHTTVYSFRNLDDSTPIEIRRVRIYTADGKLVIDMPNTQGFPPGFRDLLEPHQSTQLTTHDLFSGGLGSSQRPLQTFIDWQVASPAHETANAIDLHVGNVRLVREGLTKAEISRQLGGCQRL